jgi:putative transposase
VIEVLAVRNMVRNHSLARAISDAAWSEMRSMLSGKCEWYGRDLVVVDRWYPSSTVCSACGAHHDRDGNAAPNIREAGPAVLACEDDVRPARAQALAGSGR